MRGSHAARALRSADDAVDKAKQAFVASEAAAALKMT